MQPSSSRMRPPASRSASSNMASSSARSGSSSVAPTPMRDAVRHVGTSTGAGAGRTAGVTQGKRRAKEDGGSNIQVCVRVRGQAEGEPQPPNQIISTEGTHGPTLQVKAEPARMYNFDTVFSSEASQGMVYQHVVSPILEQVLKGYNCTIFAYGQTGTGKTHTMEGNLSSNLGTYHTEAGIIPRVLYKLFYTLDKLDPTGEYTVTATFVELYNEELRNLLGESSSLISSKQSTSSAVRTGPPGGLKILDNDSGGITIQGLHAVPMSNADAGLKLLREGSEKRHIAATRCNENSSRSHSVLTLTVYLQDTSVENEVVFRTGKLNLVDLAGSESIGRSGAENTRAREAGMINQSLLTLGRVINALVDRNSHVPYRESKLTRLLQESLGGRTKTCIIATVSADQSNVEETISTLDYAVRAKSILNKPELNTSMTRAGLLKDFVVDIERLRADVIAAREKNGIFLSEESYKSSQDALETAKRAADTFQHEKGIMESKLTDLQGQLEQRLQLLFKRDAEVKIAKDEVEKYLTELKGALTQLSDVNNRLDEECILRQAYMQSERKLDRVAARLRTAAQSSIEDVGGLFAKLDRKSAVEAVNSGLASECQRSLSAMGSDLEARISEQRSLLDRFSTTLAAQMEALVRNQERDLKSKQERIDAQLENLISASTKLRASHSDARSDVLEAAEQVDGARAVLLEAAQQQSSALRTARCLLMQGMKDQLTLQAESLSDCFVQTKQKAEEIALLAQQQAEVSLKRMAAAQEQALKSAEREAAGLRQLNKQLEQTLEEEKAEDARERGLINALLVDLAEQRHTKRTTTFKTHQKSVNDRSVAQRNLADEHCHELDNIATDTIGLRDAIVSPSAELVELSERGQSLIVSGASSMDTLLGDFDKQVEETTKAEIRAADNITASVAASTSRLRRGAQLSFDSHNADLEQLNSLANTGLQDLNRDAQQNFASLEAASSETSQLIHGYHKSTLTFLGNAAAHMSSMRMEGRTFLSERFAIDQSTGATPVRRSWDLGNTEWSLVPADRAAALRYTRGHIRLLDASQKAKHLNGEETAADLLSTSPTRPERPSYLGDATFLEDNDENMDDATFAAFDAGDLTARAGPRASHLSATSGISAGRARTGPSVARQGDGKSGRTLRAGSAASETDDEHAARSVASSSASSPRAEQGAGRVRQPSSSGSGPLSEKNLEPRPALANGVGRRSAAPPANTGIGLGKPDRPEVNGGRATSAAGFKNKAAPPGDNLRTAPPKRARR